MADDHTDHNVDEDCAIDLKYYDGKGTIWKWWVVNFVRGYKIDSGEHYNYFESINVDG